MVKKKSNSNSEIEKKREEIEKLKKELEAKKEVFEMLKNGEDEELIRNKFDSNKEIFGFYQQFRETEEHTFITLIAGSYIINNSEYFRNQIRIKILEEEQYIEEKEIRVENLEYIEIQKGAIKKDNEYKIQLNNFTKILALAALIQIVLALYPLLKDISVNILVQYGFIMMLFGIVLGIIYFGLELDKQKSFDKVPINNLIIFIIGFGGISVVLGVIFFILKINI